MNQKFKSKWLIVIVTALVLSGVGAVARASDDVSVRWDLFKLEGLDTPVVTAVPGGTSIAAATFQPFQLAGDNSTITLTGSGTFRLDGGRDVTGGGTWKTATATGTVTGMGTYKVTELVRFEFAPGTFTFAETGIVDGIGNEADARAGLAVMKVAYSDGTKGILTVTCAIVGTPLSVIEGATATKGFVDYYNTVIPDFTFGNTLFHVQAAHE
jgi:hypothetical protein